MVTRSVPWPFNVNHAPSRVMPVSQVDIHPIGLILPALLLAYAAILPTEFRFSLADQNFYAPRIVGLMTLPIILYRFVKLPIRYSVCDLAVLLGAGWMVLAFSVYYGPDEGFLRGSALAFDTAIPYFTARACFREFADIRRFLVLVAPPLFIAGGTLLVEILADQPLVKPAFANIFGAREHSVEGAGIWSDADRRFGLIRATGPFPHPILAGLFVISFLPLYLSSGLLGWPKWLGSTAAVFSIFSVSSTAIFGLIITMGLMVLNKIVNMVTFLSWRVIIPVMTLLLVVANSLTENGLIPFISRFTINPQTAFYRRLIWEYGSASVVNNPWFGIGFTGYERLAWMPETVDNHWLLIAIRYGFLPAFLLFGVVIFAIVAVTLAVKRLDAMDRQLCVGLAISLFTYTLLGFTVAFFGGSKEWFYMLVGITLSASLMAPNGHRSMVRPVMPHVSDRPIQRVPRRVSRSPRRGNDIAPREG